MTDLNDEALDELEKALRDDALSRQNGLGSPSGPALEAQAADTIAALRAENAKLREANKAEYERGQRDMRERLTTVAVEQCGGGFHDRKRMRSAIAAIPITKDEKEGEE